MLFFKKFVELHMKLADYKMTLMEEASRLGSPFTRPLMAHFSHDAVARKEHSEFIGFRLEPYVEKAKEK